MTKRNHVSRQTPIGLVCDGIVLTACVMVAYGLKAWTDPGLPFESYAVALPVIVLGCVVMHALQGLHPGIGLGPAEELRRLSLGTTSVFMGALALTFLTKSGDSWSRQILFTGWGMALVLLPIARSGLRRIMSSVPGWGEPCVIVGAGSTGRQAAMLLASRPWLGLHPIGFLDDDAALLKTRIAGLPVLGTIGDVHRTDRDAVSATYAIIALPGVDPATRARTIDRLALTFRHLLVTPALPGVPGIAAETREFADHLALEIGQNLLSPTARITKRCIDITLVMAFILTCWWLVLLLAAWIRLSSPGPAFYSQARVGQGGRPFRAWKFRSMVADADRRLEAILAADPMLRQEWEKDRKLRNDPRITAIGRFLRRTSLDELPQLWNVLAGEMSLVGPRPIVEDEIPRYGEHFALFCKVRPGMSGLWQVSGRSDTGYEERVALDCYYVRSWSIWLDLVIIARTFRVVLLGRGAY